MSTPDTINAKVTSLVAAIARLGTGKLKSVAGFFTQYAERYTKVTVTNAATSQIDLSINNIYELTLKQASSSLSFINTPQLANTNTSFSLTLYLIQGQANALVVWPNSITWEDQQPPTLSTALGKMDIVTLTTRDNGVTWQGFVSGTGR